MEDNETENSESWNYNQLKKYDIQTLENTIAKAFYDLTGLNLNCSISHINFSGENYSSSPNHAKFDVNISESYEAQIKRLGFEIPEQKSEI